MAVEATAHFRNRVTVMLADDSLLIRVLLRKLIESQERYQVLDVAMNWHDLLQKWSLLHPDIVVGDLAMPFYEGRSSLQPFLEGGHSRLLLSSPDERHLCRAGLEAMELGAADILSKRPLYLPQENSGFKPYFLARLQDIQANRVYWGKDQKPDSFLLARPEQPPPGPAGFMALLAPSCAIPFLRSNLQPLLELGWPLILFLEMTPFQLEVVAEYLAEMIGQPAVRLSEGQTLAGASLALARSPREWVLADTAGEGLTGALNPGFSVHWGALGLHELADFASRTRCAKIALALEGVSMDGWQDLTARGWTVCCQNRKNRFDFPAAGAGLEWISCWNEAAGRIQQMKS